MMKSKLWILAACIFAAGQAFAQDDTSRVIIEEDESGTMLTQPTEPTQPVQLEPIQPQERAPAASSAATQPSETQRSEAQAKGEEEKNQVGVTHLALRPSAGAIFYNGNQRFAGGVLLDTNFINTPWAKVGIASGALYSSLGSGDFFNGISTSNNNYIFQIPANVKVTGSPESSGRLQLGAHGGANIIYSSAGAASVGAPFGGAVSATGGGASFDAHPNVGADIDFALGTNADITLRPDVTFLSEFNMVTTTLGLAVKL